MSLFGNLFSSKPDYPAIDPSSTAASRIAEVKNQLGELAGQVKDPLEVIPTKHAAYVFIGKPPKRFGLAWIHDGKISGLNTLVEEHGLKPLEVEKVLDQLRDAYERNADVSRFCTTVQDRNVVVTPSAKLEKEVHEIIDKVVHH
ncbi:MAG: hypothetical protein OQK01_00140 [Xanthomonadales bacterium]|jgi:hypothetical protein|nr:hypothetical protein [Xanthomonadales bacterium]